MYAWCLDTSNLEGMLSCFTPDACVTDITGTRWDASNGGIRAFAQRWINVPGRRGIQHLLGAMTLARDGDEISSCCYFATAKWDLAAAAYPGLGVLGVYLDKLIRTNGSWYISAKTIHDWHGYVTHSRLQEEE